MPFAYGCQEGFEMSYSERAVLSDDALVMIVLRQLFYLQQFRLVCVALLLNIFLIISLISMLTYFIKHPVHPIYFSTDHLGRLLVDTPLSQPNMPVDAVGAWVAKAVEAAYSYDFVNYRKQFQGAQKYFTDFGWKQYMKGLDASNNLLALTQHKLVVSAKVVAQPKVVVQGILNKNYAWKFEMPVLVTYWESPYDDKSKYSNPLMVSVTVIHQRLLESDHGLGIVQMIAEVAGTNPAVSVNLTQ